MINLNANIRESSLKPNVLRASGLIPAEIYSKGFNNLHITVSAKEFSKVFEKAGENTVVDLLVGKNTYSVLIHDYQKHPISDQFLAVDFLQIRLDVKITAPIPLVFIGESPAVKEMEGILVKSMDKIEVEALPSNLPHEIEINISAIKEIDGSIYVRDIPASDNYKIITDLDTVIATVILSEEEVVTTPTGVENIITEGEAKRAESTKTKDEDS